MKPVRNSKLEELRESVLKEKGNEAEALRIVKLCKNIHAIYLFLPDGFQTLKKLCSVISSTPSSIHESSWKDLAAYLGLTFHQIGCIENYKYQDYTEMVIKTYAQRKDATIGAVIEGLYHCSRYDAISVIKKPLTELVELAKRLSVKTADIDSGHPSLAYSITSSNDDGILRPEVNNSAGYELPITLREVLPMEKIDSLTETVQEIHLQRQNKSTTHSSVRCSKRVMVTFSKDGEVMANLLTKQFRKERDGMLPIGVLILNEHPDKVTQNPEKFITHIFRKMDYVIPILTEGYFEALGKKPNPGISWASSIDPQYVQLIHDLMSKYYVENCCRNDKIRCIIPNQHLEKVLKHPHMRIDPVLKVFFKESETDDLAKRIIRSASKRAHNNG